MKSKEQPPSPPAHPKRIQMTRRWSVNTPTKEDGEQRILNFIFLPYIFLSFSLPRLSPRPPAWLRGVKSCSFLALLPVC